MTLEAKLIEILPLQSGKSAAGKDWQKVTAIVETPGKYPKKVALEFFNKAIDTLTGLRPGQSATFHIDLDSREYQGRWYTSVTCFKAQPQQQPPQQPYAAPQGYAQQPQAPTSYEQAAQLYAQPNPTPPTRGSFTPTYEQEDLPF